jgi:tRNA pseudouridine32 synthase/23S rRNA pseudouridine746 synthase
MNRVIETSVTIDEYTSSHKASSVLSEHTDLSQAKIKDAMHKGAVWLYRANRKSRLRRASKQLHVGDKLELNYNAKLLGQAVPECLLIHDAREYSVWYKPYGVSCQGSRWGDFASINRWVEVNLPKIQHCAERPVHLVHRLDRATTGVILLCHSKSVARLFSDMFQHREIQKRYQAIVRGDFSTMPAAYEVKRTVGEKSAHSVFSNLLTDGNFSLVDVELITGRKHQIRQHLSILGYPVVGDRLYGRGGDDQVNLQLQSVSLTFQCPIRGSMQSFSVAEHLRLRL